MMMTLSSSTQNTAIVLPPAGGVYKTYFKDVTRKATFLPLIYDILARRFAWFWPPSSSIGLLLQRYIQCFRLEIRISAS